MIEFGSYKRRRKRAWNKKWKGSCLYRLCWVDGDLRSSKARSSNASCLALVNGMNHGKQKQSRKVAVETFQTWFGHIFYLNKKELNVDRILVGGG